MVRQVGMFDVEDRLAGLSRKGDGLERLAAVVDFELFRPELERAVPRADRSRGGRPPFDHVLMFKVLILQTQNNLSRRAHRVLLGRDRAHRAGVVAPAAGAETDVVPVQPTAPARVVGVMAELQCVQRISPRSGAGVRARASLARRLAFEARTSCTRSQVARSTIGACSPG
jgi:hypothetical protein